MVDGGPADDGQTVSGTEGQKAEGEAGAVVASFYRRASGNKYAADADRRAATYGTVSTVLGGGRWP